MRTNIPGVFCGGDLATFPLEIAKNRMVNIGHWQMAQAHGDVAAAYICGENSRNLTRRLEPHVTKNFSVY